MSNIPENNLLNVLAKTEPGTPCLALRPREAAKALGVSDRTLWDWTQRGDVPHVRRGKTILYPIDALRRWLDEQTKVKAVVSTPGNGGEQ